MGTFVEVAGVGEVEFPDEMSPEDIQSALNNVYGSEGSNQDTRTFAGQELNQPRDTNAGSDILAASPSILSNIGGEIVGGLSGIAGVGFGLAEGTANLISGDGAGPLDTAAERGAEFQERTKDFISFSPPGRAMESVTELGHGVEGLTRAARTPVAGAAGLLAALPADSATDARDRLVNTVGRVIDEGIGPVFGEVVSDATGSPALGAATATLPTAAVTLAGLNFTRRLPKPEPTPTVITQNLDDAVSVGRPRLDEPVNMTPQSTLDSSTNIVRDIKRGKESRVADEVKPDTDILDAAEDLGIDLNPEHYSSNSAFRDVARSLKSRPGSALEAGEKAAMESLAARADDLVDKMGGTSDVSLVSSEVSTTLRATINDLEVAAESAYSKVRAAIPAETRVNIDSVRLYLEGKIKELGGDESLLSGVERQLLTLVRKKGADGFVAIAPTYAAIDRVRRNVGNGFNRRGPFADDDAHILGEVYALLGDTQQGVAQGFGVGEIYTTARGLVSKRKGVEESAINLFGRDLSGSLVPKIKSASTALANGDVSRLNNLLNALPESARPRVVATILGNLFSVGSRRGGQLSQGFVSTYQSLTRNGAAKDALFRHLPAEARQRFDNIGKVLTGIVRSNQKPMSNPSGSAGPIIKAFEDGSAIETIYSLGKQVVAAEGLSTSIGVPGAGTTGVLVNLFSKSKTPAIQAADEMLASPSFARAVRQAMSGDSKGANATAASSEPIRSWVSQLSAEQAAELQRVGFVSFIAGLNSAN